MRMSRTHEIVLVGACVAIVIVAFMGTAKAIRERMRARRVIPASVLQHP